ncbi:EF-hand domain-containing protein [Paucibacter sp. R3-3]|uniref:EF-hand domain-containing protein n=1 Tax=Roseateles agri TaxID=3098619 RepID=A0ABU5DGA4_9BURK|nr:EF-hand domain-containing protein [Paucibacter sp. R3-3]MDY0745310.1 EF-hand domain-containing protein [Paucibacter sp. R3-3]
MISALSSSSAAAIGAGSTAQKRPSADEMFQKLDSGDKGYLTQSDFASISKEGSDTAKAEEMFKKMDTDGDGKVTESEFKAASEKMDAARQSGGHAALGGAHSAQGAPRQAAVSASDSSSSEKTYDPADTNEDGTVSQQEQQAYDAKQAQAQVAISTYESVASAQ